MPRSFCVQRRRVQQVWWAGVGAEAEQAVATWGMVPVREGTGGGPGATGSVSQGSEV